MNQIDQICQMWRPAPFLFIRDLLIKRGANVFYNDPYIPYLKKSRKYNFGLTSSKLTERFLKEMDAVIIITDHSSYDYQWILENSNLIIDTRDAINSPNKGRVVKA